jgi:hypothetical protein
VRSEFTAIQAAFDKLPTTLTANAAVVVNAGGTGLTVTAGTLTLGGNLSIAGALTTAGAFTTTGVFSTTLAQQASVTLTLPAVNATLATLAGIETLTNKTLTAPTITGPTINGNIGGTGVWQAGTIGVTYGGTGANLSATGGASQVLKQSSVGGAITVGQLSIGDLTAGALASGTTATTQSVGDGSTKVATCAYADASSGAQWVTGNARLTFNTAAASGWLMLDDGTIGNDSSGASHASTALYSALYTVLWNAISSPSGNSLCTVATGLGGSAAADFAAHKKMELPKALGRAIGVAGAASGLSSRALGVWVGEETHVLTIAEMPAHTHTTPTNAINTSPAGGGPVNGGAGGTSGSAGLDGAHNNMQPTAFWNVEVKL